VSEAAPRDRPWPIMLTDHGLEHIDAGTAALYCRVSTADSEPAAIRGQCVK
jgi:hypothetical protein